MCRLLLCVVSNLDSTVCLLFIVSFFETQFRVYYVPLPFLKSKQFFSPPNGVFLPTEGLHFLHKRIA